MSSVVFKPRIKKFCTLILWDSHNAFSHVHHLPTLQMYLLQMEHWPATEQRSRDPRPAMTLGHCLGKKPCGLCIKLVINYPVPQKRAHFRTVGKKQKDLSTGCHGAVSTSPLFHETTFSREEDIACLWLPSTMSGTMALNSLPPLKEGRIVPEGVDGPSKHSPKCFSRKTQNNPELVLLDKFKGPFHEWVNSTTKKP